MPTPTKIPALFGVALDDRGGLVLTDAQGSVMTTLGEGDDQALRLLRLLRVHARRSGMTSATPPSSPREAPEAPRQAAQPRAKAKPGRGGLEGTLIGQVIGVARDVAAFFPDAEGV